MTVENRVKAEEKNHVNLYHVIKMVWIIRPIKPNVHILSGDDKTKIKKKTSMCNLCDYSEMKRRKTQMSTT